MARIVKRTLTGPLKVEVPNREALFICQCGLSKKQPYCDGSHKPTRAEEPGKLYQYDADGNRKEIADTIGSIATW
jgi:YD repeat-containing protein